MKRTTGISWVACVAALAGASSAAGGSATFAPLGDLPGGPFNSQAFAVSDDGSVVVGWSRISGSGQDQFRAFRWTLATGMVSLGHIGSPGNSIARAVSADGATVVGISGEAFVWTEATGMVGIGDCGAIGASADCTIVVGSCAGGQGLEAAMWTADSGWTLFGDIGRRGDIIDSFFSDLSADGSVACGQSMVAMPNVEPTRWTKETGMVALGDVPGGAHYALAWAISADGSTIVGDAIGDVGLDAWRWTEATGLVNLESQTPGVTESTMMGVSGDGSIAVGYASGINAMMWDEQHGMRSVQAVLADSFGITLPGWTLLGATAISPDGLTIVGHGFNPSGAVEAWRVQFPRVLAVGDLDGDGLVDGADLAILLGSWGACPSANGGKCPADLDENGTVDATDLALLLGAWKAR